jgi:hypothetical protein
MDAMKRALRIALSDRPLAYHPILAKVMDGVAGGVWIGQILYWDSVKELDCRNQGTEYDGWFYKSEREIIGETALTPRECRNAKLQARGLNIVDAVTRGLPPTAHYKVNYDTLEKLIETEWENQFTNGGESIRRHRPNVRYNLPSETAPRVPESTQESTISDSKNESPSPPQEYPPQKDSTHILKEQLQPCGHNISAIVSTDEGTHYCGECVAADQFAALPSAGAGMTLQPHTAGMADPQAEHREMITALAEVMHQATQCNGGKLAKTAQKLLRVPGVTPARIREWYSGVNCWWDLYDWRGQRGQAPDISAINATVAMARDGIRPDISGYGHGAPKESRLDQLQRVLGVRIDGKFGTDSKIDDNIVDGVSFKVVQ